MVLGFLEQEPRDNLLNFFRLFSYMAGELEIDFSYLPRRAIAWFVLKREPI